MFPDGGAIFFYETKIATESCFSKFKLLQIFVSFPRQMYKFSPTGGGLALPDKGAVAPPRHH